MCRKVRVREDDVLERMDGVEDRQSSFDCTSEMIWGVFGSAGEQVCSVRRWMVMRSRRVLSDSYSCAFARAWAYCDSVLEKGRVSNS